MTNYSQSAATLDFKDRKAGLVALGIFQILFGVFCLLSVPLMVFGMYVSPPGSTNAGMMVPSLLMYVALGVGFIWLGIGSIRARRWARALLLIASWFWLISGTIALGFILVFLPRFYEQMGRDGQMPRQILAVVQYVVLGFCGVLYIVVPGIGVLFYGSRHVKATCERHDPTPRWTDACPLPILGVSVMAIVMAACMPAMGFYGWAVPFFGTLLTGVAGAAAVLVTMLLLGCVACGLYRLDVRAWWGAVILVAAWGVSAALTFSRVGLMDFYATMHFPAQQMEMLQRFIVPMEPVMVPLCELWVILVLGYLVFARRYLSPGAVPPLVAPMHEPDVPPPAAEASATPSPGAPSGGLAIASFVLGILSVVSGIFIIGGLLGGVGILLGMVHLLSRRTHRVFAGWGIGLSIVGVLLAMGVAAAAAFAFVHGSHGGSRGKTLLQKCLPVRPGVRVV